MQKTGRLELMWTGKYENDRLESRILVEDKTKSYGDANNENLLIHGDNLLALKALEQNYVGKIKCIYIEIILAYLIQRAGIIKKCAFAV